ncbi:GNAT family N-acetyltransferase [Flammeovirga pacifica]|uniref:GNAT family N-acetyltransferase n=1 Tax=Flammeovirga pacifica TaxID=915059 RepID=UPI0018FED440|nr:GNAT family N-acetyltransferase [Flammeovirga pacifica]
MKNNQVSQFSFPAKATILSWQPQDYKEYLKVYRAVGDAWGWTGSTLLETAILEERIHSKNRLFYLLQLEGETAGFIEYVIGDDASAEVLYFGLTPKFIGKKLGLPFLSKTMKTLFDTFDLNKIWLHTCEYDHPSAIKNYEKVGFEVIKEELVEEPYDEQYLEDFKKKYHE